MGETALRLLAEPEFRLFAIAALVGYILVFMITEWFVTKARARRTVEMVVTSIFVLFCLVWGVHNDRQELLLDTEMGARKVSGGVRVRLQDVTTVDGSDGAVAGQLNRSFQRADEVYARLFQRLNIRSPGAISALSAEDWSQFAATLSETKRRYLGGTPFALLEITASDGSQTAPIALRSDDIQIRSRRGEAEGWICIHRIFDARERSSDERETIVLTHGTSRCR